MDGVAAGSAGDALPVALGEDLVAALAANGAGLRLDLQPICAAANLAPVGYEALLRWDHPAFGTLDAPQVLHAAAAAGRGIALDAWVLVTAFRMRAGWKAGGPYLAVNVSAAGIVDGHAAPMIRAAVESTGVDPRALLLEMPEAAVMRDLPAAANLAAAMRRIGIAVSLDDFGSVSGSMLALRDIPFGTVKLDPLLTAGVERPGPEFDRSRAIVSAVIDMAHALGATTVAEAVESADQLRTLRDAGCDVLQGWLLGRPGSGPA